ncbi:hypothetical protein [Brevibacillus centrosporus]|uniref:hypothetical protein n=1 Tax=Brevibacillus centrosporus TaxID=54910 RepID=UPI002E241694|nr:hypothetical protein [Brevibacillus centrosporus]
MSKILVTPTEANRLYIHPDTKQEFPSGATVETDHDWFVKAKLSMGHLKQVESDEPPSDGQKDEVPSDGPLSLESFEKLSAAEQTKELIRLSLASDEKDDAVSNKEKRLSLYEGFLNGSGE